MHAIEGGVAVVKKQIWWGCGYSFLACQWLSNGTFGSTWLPQYGTLGPAALVGQIVVYANYVLVLAVAILGARYFFPVNDRPVVRTLGTLGVMLGNALCIAAGCYMTSPWLYPLGTWCISTGITFLYLGWGEYYCAVGARSACIVISLSLVVGSVLFALLGIVAQHSFVIAAVALVVLIPFSQFFMARGWRNLDSSRREAMASMCEPMPSVTLGPYLVVTAVFGLSLGILIGLVRTQDVATPPFVWTVGMCLMCFLVLLIVARYAHFNYLSYARTVSPVLIICLLLIPLFWRSNFAFACVLVCAAYMSANIFYQVTYVEIAQTAKVALLPLIACGTGADAIGVVVGESLCDAMRHLGLLSFEAVYLLVLIVASLILLVTIRRLRDRELQSLWGFCEREDGGVSIEECCDRIAAQVSLTPREREVLEMLVRGRTAQEMAEDMVVSLATTRTHVRNLYRKIDVHSQAELIRKVVYGDKGSQG